MAVTYFILFARVERMVPLTPTAWRVIANEDRSLRAFVCGVLWQKDA